MLVQRKKMVGERWYKGGKIAKLKRSAVFSKFFVLLLGITWKIRQRDIDAAKSGGESFTWSLEDKALSRVNTPSMSATVWSTSLKPVKFLFTSDSLS